MVSTPATPPAADPSAEPPPSALRRLSDGLVRPITAPILGFFETFGRILLLLGQTAYWFVRPPFRWRQYAQALDFVGVGSLSIILMVGLFTGAAFSLQTVTVFRMFSMESLIGPTVAMALARELAPVLTALMLTARAGAAMATELGSMRITEQIDALHTMAVSPVQYLVVPRVVATIIMAPLLTMVFTLTGILGAYVVAVGIMEVDHGWFVSNTEWMLDAWDLNQGLIKSAFFGLTLSIIGCQQGFDAKGGAKGVGLATTQAVVYSCVTILMLDYFLSDILFIVYPYE
jgi:phospholipid/cholesterol/gamma-HCH transport system permease protein